MRDLYRLLRELLLSYMHTFKQNPHKLLFSVCADSSTCTLHICGLSWQPQTNHSPFPFHSPAHIPVWIKRWGVLDFCFFSWTGTCDKNSMPEWLCLCLCVSSCSLLRVFICMYVKCPHAQHACKKRKTKLTFSLPRTQTLSWHRPERKQKHDGQQMRFSKCNENVWITAPRTAKFITPAKLNDPWFSQKESLKGGLAHSPDCSLPGRHIIPFCASSIATSIVKTHFHSCPN